MLSIITVAKGRIETTKMAFNSIWDNADNPEDIEHLIMVDCNDKDLRQYIGEYIKSHPVGKVKAFTVCFCKSKAAYSQRKIHRDYWNPLAKNSSGDVIFGLCNDTIILTKGFDKIICDSVIMAKKELKHSYFQILVDDDSSCDIFPRVGDMCSWIILTKPVLDIIGGIVPDEITFAGGDSYVYNLFRNTTIRSQIDLITQIKTLHLSHYNGSADRDIVTESKPVHNADVDVKNANANNYLTKLDLSILKEYYANTKN